MSLKFRISVLMLLLFLPFGFAKDIDISSEIKVIINETNTTCPGTLHLQTESFNKTYDLDSNTEDSKTTMMKRRCEDLDCEFDTELIKETNQQYAAITNSFSQLLPKLEVLPEIADCKNILGGCNEREKLMKEAKDTAETKIQQTESKVSDLQGQVNTLNQQISNKIDNVLCDQKVEQAKQQSTPGIMWGLLGAAATFFIINFQKKKQQPRMPMDNIPRIP